MGQSKTCPQCGDSFTPEHFNQKYCSKDCRHDARKAVALGSYHRNKTESVVRASMQERACVACGTPFKPWKSDHKYCSRSCSAAARYARSDLRRFRPKCWTCGVEISAPYRVCDGCRVDPRKIRKDNDRRRKARQYGLDVSQLDWLFASQGHRCALCGSDKPKGRGWSVDHDHRCCDRPGSCGKCVRGVLCGNCNVMLGIVNDNKDMFSEPVREYIDRRPFL